MEAIECEVRKIENKKKDSEKGRKDNIRSPGRNINPRQKKGPLIHHNKREEIKIRWKKAGKNQYF